MFSAGLLTGLVASVAGFSTPLSVLLGTVGALCLGYVISLFARRFSGAGAMYEYLVHGAHPGVGVFGAGLYGVGVLFLGGGGVFIANGFLAQAFFSAHLHIDVTWWIWARPRSRSPSGSTTSGPGWRSAACSRWPACR